MPVDKALREHVIRMLRWEDAHLGFNTAIADLPVEFRGSKPQGFPHTPWQLLEHMRICQWDILEFSRNAEHVSPEFPAGYWPDSDTPPDSAAWDRSVQAFRDDLQAFRDILADSSTTLLVPIPHGDAQTILREALLLVDHNSYHLGQLIAVRRLLGAWPPRS